MKLSLNTFFIAMIFISAIFDIGALTLIKKFLNDFSLSNDTIFSSEFIKTAFRSKIFISGLILFISSPILFLFAITKMDLSYAYPLNISFKIILNIALSYFFLKEKIKIKSLIGIILIISGILII